MRQLADGRSEELRLYACLKTPASLVRLASAVGRLVSDATCGVRAANLLRNRFPSPRVPAKRFGYAPRKCVRVDFHRAARALKLRGELSDVLAGGLDEAVVIALDWSGVLTIEHLWRIKASARGARAVGHHKTRITGNAFLLSA